MRKIIGWISKSFIIFFCLGVSATLQSQPLSYPKEVEERIKQVEENLSGWIQTQDPEKWTLKERMEFHNVPGLSMAVIHNYRIDWVKCYGFADIGKQQPVTPQTLFQAASLSKSVNAAGLLKLAEEKKLDLYADINEYLISWKFPYDSLSKNKKISLANLLSHTAGLTVHGFPGYKRTDSIPTIYQVLNGIKPANTKAVRSQFEAGLRSQYSGGGTVISQLILQDLTGQAYGDYLYNKVLKPMGMVSSSYTQPPTADKQAVLATAYYADGREVEGGYHVYPEQAPAGLWTNPTDMARFIIETQLSYQGRSNKVLSQQSTKLMLTPYIDQSAALGVFINTMGADKYFQHGGANEGFRCQYYGSLENGNGVVVMVNSDNGAILSELVNSVAIVYQWKDFYKPLIKKTITVADEILESYTGEYEFIPQFIIIVTKENNQLKAWATGEGKFDIFPESQNKFFYKIVDAQLEFIKGEKGKIIKVVLYQNGRQFEGKKIK